MAELLVSSRHVFERAAERCRVDSGRGRKLVEELVRVVKEQAPDDWRFTTSPTAKFIIACEPGGADCRFLGRSWRDRDGIGDKLLERLRADTITASEMAALADEYRQLLNSPDCRVIHELKTCYGRGQDLSEEKDIYFRLKEAVPHNLLIDPRRAARRPNAIVEAGRLWVRQGEYYDRSRDNGGDPREYLLFVRLTPDGPDWGQSRIYEFNRQGVLKVVAEASGKVEPRRLPARPAGTRSQNYWTLPTRLDAVRLDIEYACSSWSGDDENPLEPACLRLLLRLQRLQELVRPGL